LSAEEVFHVLSMVLDRLVLGKQSFA